MSLSCGGRLSVQVLATPAPSKMPSWLPVIEFSSPSTVGS